MPVFEAVVQDGRLHLSDAARYRAYVASLGDGEICEVAIRRPKSQRTYEQLRYWFGVPMAILSEHTGHTKLQLHYMCLALCFGVITDATTGMALPVVPASRHLTTQQFSELIEWVGPWAWETFGVRIPLPHEVDLSTAPGVDEEG